MSSTQRGSVRHIVDYYVTPHEPIRQFLALFMQDETTGPKWFDCCAGGDDENPMSYPHVIKEELGIEVVSNDIREDSLAQHKTDYLMSYQFEGFDVVITNPPFDIAQAIIEKAIANTRQGGFVIMLLRLNFFGSAKRRAFFTNNMPYRVYVHSKRISFMNGQTDSIEYAHFVWKVGTNPKNTLLTLI